MKTKKAKKTVPELDHPISIVPRSKKSVLIRDLMKTIYIFGFYNTEAGCVTDLKTALCALKTEHRFYVYPGGEVVYEVSPHFYQAIGLSPRRVARRLKAVFAPPPAPEAMGL
ncbi:MAG: hypothetical protein FJ030_12620 [Chloroflexi bacterium]|nr:hypothetical protein [Chloroflexota bacterium]